MGVLCSCDSALFEGLVNTQCCHEEVRESRQRGFEGGESVGFGSLSGSRLSSTKESMCCHPSPMLSLEIHSPGLEATTTHQRGLLISKTLQWGGGDT